MGAFPKLQNHQPVLKELAIDLHLPFLDTCERLSRQTNRSQVSLFFKGKGHYDKDMLGDASACFTLRYLEDQPSNP